MFFKNSNKVIKNEYNNRSYYLSEIDNIIDDFTNDAEPTYRKLPYENEEEWVQEFVTKDGREGLMYHIFTEYAIESSGYDPDGYPWDNEFYIDRFYLKED